MYILYIHDGRERKNLDYKDISLINNTVIGIRGD